MTCKTCGGPLTGKQTMYCSHPCAWTGNGQRTGGRNRARITIACQNCGADFEVVPSRRNARACSRACLGALQSRERKGVFGVGGSNPNYKDGRAPASYRRQLKSACERCDSTTNLLIHHQNEDRHDNRPGNLETLCKRCHQLHHRCWENLPYAMPPTASGS